MSNNEVLVEISARHVHLSQADLETLFGAGYELTVKKELSQPGQYACEERVRVVGTKGEFAAVSILGPVRNATQVEISLTDARSIGVAAPVRESGDIAGSGLASWLVLQVKLKLQRCYCRKTPHSCNNCGCRENRR